MKYAGHYEAIKKGTFLMVCSGDGYFTEIVCGENVFDRMMVAMFGDDWKNNADSEQIERERDALNEPDNWSMDSNFGPTQYQNDMEDASITILLITGPISVSKRKVVCLCGSLRFPDEFKKQELEHLKRGEIALMPCCMWTDIQRFHGAESDYKKLADEHHKRLIDLADEVLVLNVGGYIGNSTRSEIEYAEETGKPIVYLQPVF